MLTSILLTLALASTPPQPADGQRPTVNGPFLKGMTVSCQTWGPEWGTPAMREALVELRDLGVEWVAIHPYARVERDGHVRFQPTRALPFLAEAAKMAREERQRLFLKPHLAYWGSFSWRGDIAFPDEAAWRRFFESYEAWIVDQARFAEAVKAPLFAVGTELEKTVHREADWRRVIARVRRVYSGQLTWAANWDGVSRVPFWDALDVIGVQAYFPLVTAKAPVDRGALEAGWRLHLAELEALSRRHRKPVLFTEIGYARSPVAAHEPWKPALDGRPEVLALRRLLVEVALAELRRAPFVRGAFWWKWMPGPAPHDADFSMKDPEVRAALERAWRR